MLGRLFPRDEANLAAMALEARNSRHWAGTHFALDNDVGATGGAQIGRLVIALAAEGAPVGPSVAGGCGG